MTQDWKQLYASKLEPATSALKRIRRGDRVFIGSACGEPQALVHAMVEVAGSIVDTEVVHVLTLGVAPYTDPQYAPNFRANAFFIGNAVRDAVNQARADYTPIFLSQVPGLFKSGQVELDVALVMVSPPDEHGYCSLGVSVDITKAALESARLVIAQVNRNMPHTLGDCAVHVSKLHSIVEHNEPLLEWPMQEPDDVIKQIAANIARLVPDGATLQLGIGRIPDAVLSALADKHDLGIHTEMFSDGVMQLAEAGVITGKRKTLNQGKIVGSFAAGTRRLFEWLDHNHEVEMYPSDYINSVAIISQHDHLHAINSALQVDLTGQVVADSIGNQFYSGIGGHADFIRGAALSRGGKPIIAMPSTAHTKDGLRSRITAALEEGAGVVTTRGDTHYVVTEYGVAFLHGRTMRERAMSLINIAHPDFRGELLHAAKRRHIVYPDQIMPPVRKPYPAKYEETVTLTDGTTVLSRPIKSSDEPMMKEMFYSFSEQTVYLRYHGQLKSMPHNKLQVFCNVDYDTEMAILAVVGQPGNEDVIGVGRYMTDIAKSSAELAFVVADAWQRKGLGTYLFQRLMQIAQSQGIRKYSADVLVENSGMLKIFHRSGLNIETTTEAGVVHVTMTMPQAAGAPAS